MYEPEEGGARSPLIVMAHGLGAVKEMRLDAYAERFMAAGYRVLWSTIATSERAVC